jgi:GT2 family glycosyltransferase
VLIAQTDNKFVKPSHPKVGIIILNWNGKEHTIECLESLQKITYPNFEIILVDNGSTDGSVEHFKKNFHDIYIIENKINLGFAEGNNIGIKYALGRGADYVLLLNNDTIVDRDFLTELVKIGESDPDIGIVGPMIYSYDHPRIIQSAGMDVKKITGNSVIIGCDEYDHHQFKLSEKNFISGCAILIRRNVINKIGGLDPAYFAYWEDTDLCFRAKKNNFKIYFTPDSRIWHKGSASMGGYLNEKAYYFYVRNSTYYFYKNYSYAEFVCHMAYKLTFFTIRLLGYSIYNKRYDLIRSHFQGLRDSFKIIKNPGRGSNRATM